MRKLFRQNSKVNNVQSTEKRQFFSDLTRKRLCSFRKNSRAWNALLLFACILFVSLLAELIANDKPLILKYKGEFYFPVFSSYDETVFGGDFPTPTDYKDELIKQNIQKDGWMIMPIIPLSIVFAFVLTIISSLIGMIAGALQGYWGGKVDLFMQRLLEIWDSLPQLFLLIIVASIFVPTFWTLLAILLFFSWTSLVGVVRAEFMRTRNFEYVKAAQALGVSNWRIMYRHILPNAMVATITFVPFLLSEAIVSLTALDFLGLGLSQEYPSLGDLVRQGKDNLQAPWIGVTIFIVLSSLLTILIFIGEGVRDAFDSRRNG